MEVAAFLLLGKLLVMKKHEAIKSYSGQQD